MCKYSIYNVNDVNKHAMLCRKETWHAVVLLYSFGSRLCWCLSAPQELRLGNWLTATSTSTTATWFELQTWKVRKNALQKPPRPFVWGGVTPDLLGNQCRPARQFTPWEVDLELPPKAKGIVGCNIFWGGEWLLQSSNEFIWMWWKKRTRRKG